MKLYSYWRSSSSWRVRIALALKGLPYEYVPVHLLRDGGEQLGPAFSKLNPMQQLPCLVVPRGFDVAVLTQSLAIIEFLEETHPAPPLLPREPFARAKVRQLAEMVNAGIQPLQNLAVLQEVERQGHDKQAWGALWVGRGLRALEIEAGKSAGRCMMGDDVTLADVYLVPQLYAAARFGLDASAYPTLARIQQHLETLAPFQAAHPQRQVDAQAAT